MEPTVTLVSEAMDVTCKTSKLTREVVGRASGDKHEVT